MARGNARAPSQNAYRGSIGRTRTETVHVTGPSGELIPATVYTAIDAVSDPELAERLHAGDPARPVNVQPVEGGEPIAIAAPIVYHDPAAELLVLVLGEAHRHRELDERIRLLERLRDDPAPVPAYAKDFAVVFGAAGLRTYLEERAQQALAARSHDGAKKETDRRRAELVAKEGELARGRAELDQQKAALEQARAELGRLQAHAAELERLRSEERARLLAVVNATPLHVAAPASEATVIAPPPTFAPAPASDARSPQPAALSAQAPDPNPEALSLDTSPIEREIDAASPEARSPEPEAFPIVPQGADPLTTDTIELAPAGADPWLEFAATGVASSFEVQADGRVRLALLANEQVARGLGGALDLRIVLHRLPSYPVVVMLIGPPAALRVPSPTQLAILPLDIGVEHDAAVLAALGRQFELLLDVVVRGRAIRRVQLVAPLEDNLAYLLRAADDHLRGLTADGETEPSYARARDQVLAPDFDILGLLHAEASEFRDDKLAQLGTAQQLRRALAIARRFARPSREDYLVCARGFPLRRWHELRRHVVESAVAWGLWMGPELAQVAVSEGLARSRRDLVMRLEEGFETLRHHPTAFDIDADAAEDNLKALAEEARALGVELKAGGRHVTNGAIQSDDGPVVSGSIERTPTAVIPHDASTDVLLAMLDDKAQRLAAAVELCDRGEARAAAPVIGAVRKMSRAEAVRILGKAVRFGPAAAPPLIEGLGSSKAFLRHGCALALALLRTEEGTQAVIDLLLSEPTEIWREIARALGQVGPPALMPLAGALGRLGEQAAPATAERVAWAMAHVGVRGGSAALEQMAAGKSVVAPVAAHALQLVATAAKDEVRVSPGGEPGRDITVNRAFSRRFFEALEAERPEDARAALSDLEASAPLELLDAELLVEDDDEAELDESDLIQT